MNHRRVDHVPRTLQAIRAAHRAQPKPEITQPGSAGGSPIQLRGIPVVGGCQGAIPGTLPHHSIR